MWCPPPLTPPEEDKICGDDFLSPSGGGTGEEENRVYVAASKCIGFKRPKHQQILHPPSPSHASVQGDRVAITHPLQCPI